MDEKEQTMSPPLLKDVFLNRAALTRTLLLCREEDTVMRKVWIELQGAASSRFVPGVASVAEASFPFPSRGWEGGAAGGPSEPKYP